MSQQPQPRGSHIHLMERQGAAAPGEIVKFVITFPQPMLAADAEAYVARNAAAIGAGTFKSVKPAKSGGPDIICTEKEPLPPPKANQEAAAVEDVGGEEIFEGDGAGDDMFGG